jgi:hypothetical protein
MSAADPSLPTGSPRPPGRSQSGRLAAWFRDLCLGARFAVSGREGWARTILAGFGLGLAVAMLLLASAIPGMLHDRDERSAARSTDSAGQPIAAPGPTTFLVGETFTSYRGASVTGILIKQEGPHAPVPPGLNAYPANGQMLVSPALGRLLDSPQGALLRPRLPYRTVGTIGAAGLLGPQDLTYYAGYADMTAGDQGVYRADAVGLPFVPQQQNPILSMLSIIGFVVMLIPVAVFLAAAVRFGGERRDRRLAALRLIGADIRSTHRIAAGEALTGALLGLAVGFGLFGLGRLVVGRFTISGFSVYGTDLAPNPLMTVLVLAAVPVLAVAVTLFALRTVAVEPLGVVRRATPARRRLWWRLPTPVLGALLLAASARGGGLTDGSSDQIQVAVGVGLVLIGVAVLLPWGLERVVSGLASGPPAIQLGSRRMQMSTGTAARAVAGITVAVAGAIAAQTVFGGVARQFTVIAGPQVPNAQANLSAEVSSWAAAEQVDARVRATAGVIGAVTIMQTNAEQYVKNSEPDQASGPSIQVSVQVMVADCTLLAQYALVPHCGPGSVFAVNGSEGQIAASQAQGIPPPPPLGVPTAAGTVLNLNTSNGYAPAVGPPVLWTIPPGIRATKGVAQTGMGFTAILATPQALPTTGTDHFQADSQIQLDPRRPDAIEYLQNTAAEISPLAEATTLAASYESHSYTETERGAAIGAIVTLLLIACSLAIGTIEQLRERRKVLSVLVAFGTKRSTLALSVLWQSTLPVLIGLTMALVSGLGLGALLLKVAQAQVTFDWPVIGWMLVGGAGAVAVATVLSLLPLWRMMRPDGLRAE